MKRTHFFSKFAFMNENRNKSEYGWIVRNLVKAAILILALVLIAQLILKIVTRHNKEVDVPDLSGMSLVEARQAAKKSDIRLDVTDSVSIKRLPKGVIFSQNPAPGSKVKKGRRIMLTINATQAKTVAMPNLIGLSLRQAIQDLSTKGLEVGKLTYKEDIATNNVLGQYCAGRSVSAGTQVETESAIDLLLGRDPSDSFTYVPHLLGFTFPVAKENILDNSLNIGRVSYDETVTSYEDTINAVVYRQEPVSSSTSPYLMGANVSIYLTTSQAKLSSAQREAAVPKEEESTDDQL